MANHSNNFDGQILIDDGNGTAVSPGGYFGFGRIGTASTGPRIYSLASNPNGVLTAPKSSIAFDRTGGGLYINTDGATAWVAISGSGGQIGPLPDDVYLVMGNDSDGQIGYNSGTNYVTLSTISGAGLRLQGGSGIDMLTTDKAGNTQGVSIVTGASTTGFSGSISIGTGEAGASSSGSIEFTTGAGTAGGADSGDITFTTSTPDTGGTQGSLIVDTKQIVPPVITTGTTVVTASIATPVTYVIDVPDGANATLTYALPYSIELYDIVLIKTDGPGIAGNTITIRTAGLVALSDAMPCEVSDGVIVRPINVAASRATLTGTSIRVERIRVGNSAGCRLYLFGVRR